MRKVYFRAAFLAAVLGLVALAGCGGGSSTSSPAGPSSTTDSHSGTGTLSAGPDAGYTIKLTITPEETGGATSGGTGSTSSSSTGTTGGGTVAPTPLTGTLVITGPGGKNPVTILLSGTAENESSGTVFSSLTKYQLTGTDSSSGTTYTVAGAATFLNVFGPATVTSSAGDSGTVGLN